MKIRTLHDIPELKGKKILLRVDFNVPRTENGEIKDDIRIVEALPTINYLREKEAKIIIMTHLGRPKGIEGNLKLDQVSKHLSHLINHPVKKLDEIVGPSVKTVISNMQNGEIVMLENIRFRNEEEACEENFTRELAGLGEIFVNDAFGTSHRKHSSTAGLAKYLPAYGGFLIEKEMHALSPLLTGEPKRPLTMIFGGAKIDTKIGVIRNFLEKADYFLIGGGIANTFLAAAGYNVGQSLFEKEKMEIAREIMLECEKNKEKLVLPHDLIVADEISSNSQTANVATTDVIGNMKIADIGKWSAEKFANIIEKSGTVIWNGPLGVTEYTPFQNGTRYVANTLANHNCTSILGGGDTADAIKNLGIPTESFTHISTGGGAAIEFLEGRSLPGIEILQTG